MNRRLAYFTNQYPKVSHTFIRREIAALESLGVEVLRFALRGWDEDLADPADLVELEKTHHVLKGGLVPLVWAGLRTLFQHPTRTIRTAAVAVRLGGVAGRQTLRHLVYLLESCWLLRQFDAHGVSHVHGHFGTNPATVLMLCRMLGGPSYSFTVHGPEEFDHPVELALSDKMEHAAFVVAISSYGRSQLWRHLRHDMWAKVRVVHCGVDQSFKAMLPQAAEPSHLVCVGRLCEQKGQLLLVEALGRLRQRGIEARLTLAGDGPLRKTLEAAVAQWGLADHVQITGWIGGVQVRELLTRAHAMVLPSFAEGLPVAIMEAMALERPVVTTYVAGIPELVRPGLEGWLVPAGDIQALVNALEECLRAPPGQLEKMGRMARERVWLRHDALGEARRLAAAFEAVLAGRACPEEDAR